MRWILEVAYIGITSSWKWLLGSTVVVGALVGMLLGIGVIGGGGEDGGSNRPSVSTLQTPIPDPGPGTTPEPTIPRVSTTTDPKPPVAPLAKLISVPILATLADNVGSLEFVLVYDPSKVELDQVKPGLLSQHALIDSSLPSPGRLWTGIVAVSYTHLTLPTILLV